MLCASSFEYVSVFSLFKTFATSKVELSTLFLLFSEFGFVIDIIGITLQPELKIEHIQNV